MVFTHRNFYTQKLLHREVFAQRRLDMKSQVEIGSSSSGKTLGRSFRALTCSPKKPSISNKVPVLFFFKKRKEYISEAGPHPKAFQPPHCDEMEGREIRRSRRGALALKFGSAGSPRVRWQMRHERPRATRALRWGAPPAADPPTPGPENHQKSFRRVGERFLAGIRVAHKRLQEHSPPPFWGYLKSEKSAVLTHFSDDFSLFESHKML